MEIVREILLERLAQDLMGPYAEDEVLASRPSDVYLTGILWPRETPVGGEEDERLALSGTHEGGTEGGGQEEELSLAGLGRPCSAGVSFAARSEHGVAKVNVTIRFATYEPLAPPQSEEEHPQEGVAARHRRVWKRSQCEIAVDGLALKDAPRVVDLATFGAPAGVKLHLRTALWSGGTLATITLLNDANPEDDRKEQATLFQVQVQVRPLPETVLVARPSRRAVLDEEDRSAGAVYRHAHEFGDRSTSSANGKRVRPKYGSDGWYELDPSATVPARALMAIQVCSMRSWSRARLRG